MSGKVYHVYVEVRDGDGLDPLMLQGPDVLPQRVSPHLAHSPALPPGTLHKGDGSNQSLSSNKSSSRHSVSFQLGPAGEEQCHAVGHHRQSLPYDGVGQLLSNLHPSHNGILMRARSTESEPFYGRENHIVGRYTAPPTPSSGRRSYGGPCRDMEGRRSVVTFGYIEKGSVQAAVDGSHSSLCQSEPENPFNRALEEEEEVEGSGSLMRKRLSDPVQFSSWETLGSSGPKLTSSQRYCLNLRRATLDSIAREATYRAMEEFGSPQIRRRMEAQKYQPQEPPRCRSWGGSPVLPRNTSTLPSNTHLVDLDRNHSSYGLPRSPATEHLSSHVRQNYYTMSPPSNRAHTYGAPSQRQWHHEDSPKLPYKYGHSLPSCKPTAIQHEIPSMTITKAPSHHQRVNHHLTDSPRSSHRVNFKLDASRNQPDEGTNHLSGRKSVSPCASPELARRLAEEASRLSTIFTERRASSPALSSGEDTNRSDSPRSGSFSRESQIYASLQGLGSPAQSQSDVSLPGPDHNWGERESVKSAPQSGHSSPLPPYRTNSSPAPARLHRQDMTPSPIRDPRLGEFTGKASPTPHRHQLPQYTGDSWSPSQERKQPATRYSQQPRDSPESHRRAYVEQTTEPPVSLASQLQRWREERQIRELDKSSQLHSTTPPLTSSREEEKRRRGVPEVDRGKGSSGGEGGTPGLSKSSSGVTGSIGEGSQLERDCLSTESSQASQQSSDSGNNTAGVQSEGSSGLGSSLRSEKIARAKWEFLFGEPAQDPHGTKDTPGASTVPSSGSSKNPTPSSSIPKKPQRVRKAQGPKKDELHRLSYHEVQQVEVELVAASPPSRYASPGTSPRMGIIRRTIKYSETDLDAVPMRCYRETDLDEVMQVQHEEEEEGDEEDLVLRSKRSMLGASRGVAGSSGGGDRRTGGGREELLVEEGVVSWASVRMLGDRKRQTAMRHPEDNEVLSRLLKGTSDCHSNNQSSLKSPVTIGNPRRISAESLDTFSRHFESIMESHRAKGTSFSSLDSEDMTSSGPPVFTFDLPTLTPEIQTQICASARQISELSFAPLARAEPLSLSDRTGGSDPTLAPFKEEAGSGSEDDTTDSTTDGPASEDNPDSPLREKPCIHIPESDPEVAERLALGSPDNLANGNKADLDAAKRLAKRLFKLDGFRKSDVARHLGKNNEFSRMVAEEYLSFFNFTGMTVDQALRAFLKEFALMGETQERERVLSHFSKRYLQCNPNTIPNEDSVHTLTCALMLLNTDLHGHNIGKRMSCMQFISNLEGLNDGQDFPRELLKALYHSIKNEKLQWTIDEEELRKSFSELAESRTDSASHTMKRVNSGGHPLASVAQQSNAQLYKNGFLVRKVHADIDGKRTPRGKRGWKSFYAILKGLILYLQKGEYRPDKQLTDEDLKNAVSIHHSLAMKAADYSKRPNVFYLRTADWRVFLFQAPNAEQMQSWITRINTVAAMFSAPPFPAAIGSQKKFSRPLLPGSTTKLTQEEQVQSHEARFRAVSSELTELRAVPPDRKVKGRELEEYKQREEYLEFEKTRYGTYSMLLRAKIRSGETDLAAFEARLFSDGGLQRAHSSPTLPQESCSSQASSSSSAGGSSSGAAARSSASSSSRRAKRSEGQRHSYRKAVKQ